MSLSSRIALLAGFCALATPLHAQRRTLADGDPEAQIMGYYAAIMQFTPVGMPDRAGRFEIGAAASLIPSLSLADRTVAFGGTKPVDANKCSAYPRLTAAKGFGRFSAELGWTPPLEVCGVKADVFSAALSLRAPLSPKWDGHVRLSGMTGHVDSDFTCSAEAVADPVNLTCYYGSVSADRIAPTALALDFSAAYQGWQPRRLEPYLSVGVRYEQVDFDVNYTRTVTQAANAALDPVAPALVPPLDDHAQFRATLARVQLAAGMSWAATGPLKLGAELYYAPGAVMTLRGKASFAFGSSR